MKIYFSILITLVFVIVIINNKIGSCKYVFNTKYFRITEYEVKKNKNIKDYINCNYLLIDAYRRGYDKKYEVYKKVDIVSKFIVCQDYGLMCEKITVNDPKKWEKYKTSLMKDVEIEYYRESIKKYFNNVKGRYLLLRYKKDNINKYIFSGDMDEYLNYAFIKVELEKKEDLIDILNEFIFREFCYKEAEKLNITKEEKFNLDRNNFRNSVIFNLYVDNEIKSKIVIKEDEASDYYDKNKILFAAPDSVDVTIMEFSDKNAAFKTMAEIFEKRENINENQIKTISQNNKVKKMIDHYKMNYRDNNYSDKIKEVVFNLKNHKVTAPINFENKYCVFFRNCEIGERIKPYSEVREEIKKLLLENKTNEIMNYRVKIFKKIYPMEISKKFKDFNK